MQYKSKFIYKKILNKFSLLAIIIDLEIQPASYNYQVEAKREMRTGAEEEYFIRGELGKVET